MMTGNASHVTISDLNAIDYALVNLSKSFQQLIQLCPQLADIDVYDTRHGDELLMDKLRSPRILLAREIKRAYRQHKLPIIDQIITSSSASVCG